MKVFQGGIEIAGQMGLLSRGLSQLGHQVSAYNTFTSYLGYYQNIQNLTSYELQEIFQNTKIDYDVLHLHYAWPITEDLQDLKTLQEQGKVVLMHFWGNDVRTLNLALRYNPYARLIGEAEFVDPSLIDQRLRAQSQVMPACIVQDFEVVPYVSEYFKRVYVLPVTVDLEGMAPRDSETTTEPLIIHAPTLPEFKGTAIIEGVIDRLRSDGYVFRYERIQGLEHTEAIARYAQADIFVDQILAGSYGVFALEGMALGKPVLSYVREDLQHHFGPSLPIQSANPGTLYEMLRRLLVSPEWRREVGSAGRRYVEQVHSLSLVANKLDWIYQQERLLAQANYSMDATLPSVIDLFGMQIDLQSPSPQEAEASPNLANVVPLRGKKKTKNKTNRRGTRKQTRPSKKVVSFARVRKLGSTKRRTGKSKVGGSNAKAKAKTTRVKVKPNQRARTLTPAARKARAAIAVRRRRTSGPGLRSAAKASVAPVKVMKDYRQSGRLAQRRERSRKRMKVGRVRVGRRASFLTGLRKAGSKKNRA